MATAATKQQKQSEESCAQFEQYLGRKLSREENRWCRLAEAALEGNKKADEQSRKTTTQGSLMGHRRRCHAKYLRDQEPSN